ncbi:MAG: sulfite exporter TauE/SafE family protein [Bdellovibrionales bacterium]
MWQEFALFMTSIAAAMVASITGFGIGSLITPLLSVSVGTKLAVALVSIPHLVATALRFWLLKSHVDRRVLLIFGSMSAIGGLLGAFLYAQFATPALNLIFGSILIFAGFMGASGLSEKMRFRGAVALAAGALSGLLGGMVGNQGGIRSAALLGFQISKESFVATATAIGLIVDGVRMPIYIWSEWQGLAANGKWILLAVVGVVAGTLLGSKLLKRIEERLFKRIISSVILILGVFMLYQGL